MDIYFILEGHNYVYEVQTTIQIFYQNMQYRHVALVQSDGITVVSRIQNNLCESELYENGLKIYNYSTEIPAETDQKLWVKRSVFLLLKKIVNIDVPWGIMTGIRPAKKVRRLMQTHTLQQVKLLLKNRHLVREDKIELATSVALKESEMLKHSDREKISLYIGIPFCPTRCLYCSFVSYSVEKYSNCVDDYLAALYKEMSYVATLNCKVENIYIGGGTPTALSSVQLEKLMSKINELFGCANEFTVECGRPDTLDKQKLNILKKYNASRISINPQTLNQSTLNIIGRTHTCEDIFNAFEMARQAGLNNINADIIVGLPKETYKDVEYTLECLEKLNPESMTIHTLAIKRASVLKKYIKEYDFSKYEEIEKMLDLTAKYATRMNMKPYYMYRQKNMTGNFENVAYAKNGYECMYNVKIMEEEQNIIALGAGAVTKLINFQTDEIVRVFNPKGLEDYITRIDEMIKRKQLKIEI